MRCPMNKPPGHPLFRSSRPDYIETLPPTTSARCSPRIVPVFQTAKGCCQNSSSRPDCSGLPDRTTLRHSPCRDHVVAGHTDCSGLPDRTSLRRVIARFCGGCLGGLFRSSRLAYILRPERSRSGVVRCFREELARTFCTASSLFFDSGPGLRRPFIPSRQHSKPSPGFAGICPAHAQ